jgi:c-di-GMP-related signal transduction protein
LKNGTFQLQTNISASAMNSTNYLHRAPLLDSRQHVLGYKLAWQNRENGSALSTGANLRQLLTLVAERPRKTESDRFFLDTGPAVLPAEILQGLSPKNTVLMLSPADLLNAGNLSLVMSLHTQGFGLALCDVDHALLESSDGLLSLMTHVELGIDQPDLTEIADFAKLAEPPLSVAVKKVLDWREFDACAARGLSAFFGNLCLVPRKASSSAELGPQAVLILQLMQMVQDNADVRDLEKVLKRDAMLSYKLFRYINSASFGIEVEIESLRHAVTMLGYAPLYRWLSLLLAMTKTAGFSPALLQAAIVRGRFIELLGQKLLSRSEAENLFVVGLFSLLDQLLGVPIQQVLRQISLPAAIAQALLSREGVYGPFLALAEACELENGGASDFADALFMTAAQVNQAHLSALVWAQNLEI